MNVWRPAPLRKDKSVKRSSMAFVIYATHTLPWRIRIALIVRIRDVYVGVDDRYIVLVVAVKASNPGLELGHWIGDLVVREITVQVVDVQVVPVASQSRVRAMDGLAKGLMKTNQTHCRYH
jgi:hypothetical protein